MDRIVLKSGQTSSGPQHPAASARLEALERALNCTGELQHRLVDAGHLDRLAKHDGHVTRRLRNLSLVPAPRRPEAIGLEVKRKDRLTSRAGQPSGTRLRHPRRAARTVHRESDAMTSRQLAPELNERPRPAPRRRAASGRVAKAVEDARNPLPDRSSGRERDDAAVTEVVEAGDDTSMPAGEDRLAAGSNDGVVVLGAFDLPGEGATQAADEGGGGKGDGRGP